MGYKKLEEIMELLTDELEMFNKSLVKLENLTNNLDNIRIKPDTSIIESILRNHLESENVRNIKSNESIMEIKKRMSKSSLISKSQLYIHYSIWLLSLIIIGFLSYQFWISSTEKKSGMLEQEQEIILLKKYFSSNPERYESYQKWILKRDSIPNQK